MNNPSRVKSFLRNGVAESGNICFAALSVKVFPNDFHLNGIEPAEYKSVHFKGLCSSRLFPQLLPYLKSL